MNEEKELSQLQKEKQELEELKNKLKEQEELQKIKAEKQKLLSKLKEMNKKPGMFNKWGKRFANNLEDDPLGLKKFE